MLWPRARVLVAKTEVARLRANRTQLSTVQSEAFQGHLCSGRELVNKKAKGQKIEIPKDERVPASNVVNLMDALKQSLSKEKAAKPAPGPKHRSAK